jgi:MerR family transcriptional regulator, repressor of the yfmOP operon
VPSPPRAGRTQGPSEGRPPSEGPPSAEGRPPAEGPPSADERGGLVGIGEAAAATGVSQRALRYYQQLGLITPCACTPGGLRRYSPDDLARVGRIRQLQSLLGLNLDEIALVLGGEDRMAQIRLAYHDEGTSHGERLALVRESLELQQRLRATVEAKRQGIEGFLTDLDARISKVRALLDQMVAAAEPPAP